MTKALFRILLLLLLPQILVAGEMDAGGPSPGLSLSLAPLAPVYDIDDVRRGAVGFRATIENRSDSPVTVAHPSVCLPAGYREGDALHFRDSHGKSEILLTVRRPGGETAVLRDGPHFFDPGNVPLLEVPPGGAKDFSIGWFFLSSRITWEDSRLAEKLFLEKGLYGARLLLRNSYPRAAVNNPEGKGAVFMDVWTGELLSNEVALEVK